MVERLVELHYVDRRFVFSTVQQNEKSRSRHQMRPLIVPPVRRKIEAHRQQKIDGAQCRRPRRWPCWDGPLHHLKEWTISTPDASETDADNKKWKRSPMALAPQTGTNRQIKPRQSWRTQNAIINKNCNITNNQQQNKYFYRVFLLPSVYITRNT